MNDSHIFTGNPLDRGERERRDEDWLRAQEKAGTSRFLPFKNLDPLLAGETDPELAWLTADDLDRLGIDATPVFLGRIDGTSHFAVDASGLEGALGVNESHRFEEARAAATILSHPEAAIVAQARAQLDWHLRHGFCSVCGQPTEPLRGGQMRKCPACGASHFPRTDPVVIVVVSDGERCLLGQSRGRLNRLGWYSALAGFMDQGESIEEAVRREVGEEAGIEVGAVRYHSSQPWPFPSSLMIGCHADALTTAINRDDEEMADVRWFDRETVRLALAGQHPELRVPGPIAIAHHLIKAWALGDA